ncbi:HAMP domain-containing sensor histidine kinase [uncultured Clostridium sp.]|uniref:HAMP domain-containing sensor histidine kinase n=1 Tax=uncultured Clostridium sp. TaxID=59620 RepID=UPI0028EB1EA8|nr:HAMP domain-containing sensor histidine kinase [uncultured Clostridium sp.]
MDIKLKNNKKTINKYFIIISLCIAILPILLGLSAFSTGLINNRNISDEKSKIYDEYIPNIIESAFFYDEDGNLRNDVIARKIESLQLEYKISLQNNQKSYEDYLKDDDHSADKLKDLKESYDNANSSFYESYDEYKNEAIDYISKDVHYLKIVNNPINLEFYIEFKGGQVVSNISGSSIDSIIDETKSKSKDYLMLLDISNNSPKQAISTHTMDYKLDKLLLNYYIFKDPDVRLSNIIIRLPSSLKEGDELYTITQKDKISNIIGYGSSILLALDIIIMFILIFKLKKQKDMQFKSTNILKLHSKLPIEVKILTDILILNTLSGLYDIIAHWGNDLIENYISYVLGQVSYLHIWSSFCMQLFILLIITSAIGYLILCDIYQLYLNKNIINAKQYVQKNSIFFRVHNKLNSSFFNKSMNKKIKLALIIFIIYLVSIVWSIWLVSTHGSFIFYLLNNIWPYGISPFKFIGSLIISILGTVFIVKYIIIFFIDINKLKITTDNIIKGTYSNDLEIKNSSILKELADNIINIEQGLDKAIGNAVKSERMKSELITNVSHDLKTPLTSIINYVDLLNKDNISEEKKKEYLGVLAERSARLKVLIEDLFEASKAASGNLEMHMENLDPVALLRQTLGEFEDRINTSNLNFIKNIPQQKLNIYADGRRTFRIFQNLISNILKYSLSGTRVYIDVEDKNNFVLITFKNISKYPLTFSEEEILERFKRGDASRTTEGSGLGLSIAKSLAELQKGIFELKFDGDLFKVSISLKKEKF